MRAPGAVDRADRRVRAPGAVDRADRRVRAPDAVDWSAVAGTTGHRPWPVPSRPFAGTMSWLDLLFAHWPVDAAAACARLPPGLELDTFDGAAWLGVVPFRMDNVGPRGWPRLPGVAAFPELNVRTYVRRDGKPGVWFFSLDASSRVAVEGARLLFALPYFRARMTVERTGADIAYRSERRDGRAGPGIFSGRYRPRGAPAPARPGSLEHFLTERYCLYAARGGRLLRAEVQHRPWPLQTAEADIDACSVAEAFGFPLVGKPALLHFAARLDVVVWRAEGVGPGQGD